MNERTPDEEQLRALLEDAVSDVEPRHGLDSIRSRTQVPSTSSRRPWVLGAAAAVAATAATVVAVALVGSDSPSAGPGPVGPAAGSSCPSWPRCADSAGTPSETVPSTAAPAPPAAAVSQAVPVYYVGDTTHGPRLYREFHQATTADPLDAALQAAVGRGANGQSVGPMDPDYRTDWPAMTDASGTFDGDTITVDLSGDPQSALHDRPAGMSAAEAELAVQQLVYTAQAATQTTAPVQLLLSGKHTDTVLGVPASEPLARGDASSTLAQVWIIEPAQGARVPSGFKVSGLAAAFEANVQWELKQGGTVVKKGFTTAQECCTMAPYSFTVDAPPGDYTLVVHDEDPSNGEGPGPWQDTKDITITN